MTVGLFLFFVVHLLQVARSGWGNFRSMITGYVIERRSAVTNSVASVPGTGTDNTEIRTTSEVGS